MESRHVIPFALLLIGMSPCLRASDAVGLSREAASLCKANEKLITSFRIARSQKTASICEERNASYLVYRFGTNGRVELQYPSLPDEISWEKFELDIESSYRQATLSFVNEGQAYAILQKWSREGIVDSALIVDRPDRMPLTLQAASTQGRLDSMDGDFTVRRFPAVSAAMAAAEAAAAAADAAAAMPDATAWEAPPEDPGLDHAGCGCSDENAHQ